MRNWYHIGEISALFQVPVETLRYYDKEGLIQPEQVKENGYRLYGSTQLERICTVLSLRSAGVPMSDIRRILGADSAEKALLLLDVQADVLETRITDLLRSRIRMTQTRDALRTLTDNPDPVVRNLPALYLMAIPFRYDQQGQVEPSEGELDIDRTRSLRSLMDPGWIKGASVFSTISEEDVGSGRYHRYAHYGLLSEEPLSIAHPYVQRLDAGPYVVAYVRVHSLSHREVDPVYDRMRVFADSLGLQPAGSAMERTVFDLEPETDGGHIHYFSLMLPVKQK